MITVEPMDTYNETLVRNVHPRDWMNPAPKKTYNLVVVGAGTAGLVTAAIGASLGAHVALVERYLMGGDCLNVGCVPSKSIIRSSRVLADCREGGAFGARIPARAEADFAAVMERMRGLRSEISVHDSAARYRELGVDVFLGEAHFTERHRLKVDGRELHFRKAVIATGARAEHPPIPGLEEAGFVTNESVFSLTTRPDELVVIGGGPIGCELAQAFRRLGSTVTIIQSHSHFLPREDPDASAIVARAFERDGIRTILGGEVKQVTHEGEKKQVLVRQGNGTESISADQILVAVGRAPNVKELNLMAADVAYDVTHGVVVDDHLCTTNPDIYAAGDVCSAHKFTHMADFMARIVARNALFPFLPRQRYSDLVVPWCTYTDPEIAHVGAYERELQEKAKAYDTIVVPFSDVDRAVLDGEEEGFLKVHVEPKKGHILGATLVARHAGEMLSEITLAMVHGIPLSGIGRVIHPYPTQAEAIRKASDQYSRRALTPGRKKILAWILSRMR